MQRVNSPASLYSEESNPALANLLFPMPSLCPLNPEGRGYIVFGADPVGVVSAFISMHYLLNQWMDFDQACKDTLLG